MIKVIKFGASWCTPCKTFEPVFKSIAKEYKDKAIFVEKDIEECEEEVEEYQIRSVPTLLFLDEKGVVVGRIVGTVTKETVIESLEGLLTNAEQNMP